MIKLTNKEKEYIEEYSNGNIIINGKKYYFKLVVSANHGFEIIIEHLSKLVGIKCAHYEMININGTNYYLTEDLAGTDEFYDAYELGLADNSLYDIWNVLEMRYPDKSKYLMDQIVKIFIFDIITLNNDRNYGNYGFKFINGQIEDVYILDNESSFQDGEIVLSSKFDYKDKLNNSINIDKVPYELQSSMEDLEYFLQTSSSEYQELFKNMYEILTPELIKEELNKVEIKKEYKDDALNVYNENYELIGKLLNKRGLKWLKKNI